MKFVLNGCSYAANYYLVKHLVRNLGYNEFFDLAKGGRSNRQLIRTTLEYIEEHGADFVLLSLSFWDRFESPFIEPELGVDNWVNYRRQGTQSGYIPAGAVFISGTDNHDIDKYIGTRYQYEVSMKCIDQQMCDLVMFTAYLDSKNIKYLIYNACETNYGKYFDTVSPKYRTMIERNPRIVPLDKFISNLFLSEHGATWAESENQWPPHAKHYDGEYYVHLNNYLLHYLTTNNLIWNTSADTVIKNL